MITCGAVFTLESLFLSLVMNAYSYGLKCQVMLLLSCYGIQHCVNLSGSQLIQITKSQK